MVNQKCSAKRSSFTHPAMVEMERREDYAANVPVVVVRHDAEGRLGSLHAYANGGQEQNPLPHKLGQLSRRLFLAREVPRERCVDRVSGELCAVDVEMFLEGFGTLKPGSNIVESAVSVGMGV